MSNNMFNIMSNITTVLVRNINYEQMKRFILNDAHQYTASLNFTRLPDESLIQYIEMLLEPYQVQSLLEESTSSYVAIYSDVRDSVRAYIVEYNKKHHLSRNSELYVEDYALNWVRQSVTS